MNDTDAENAPDDTLTPFTPALRSARRHARPMSASRIGWATVHDPVCPPTYSAGLFATVRRSSA